MNPNDYDSIVPRAVPPGAARVTEVQFALRTMVDYDMDFLRDRVVTTLFVNGKPSGNYCAFAVPDDLMRGPFDPAEAIRRYGAQTERNVIDEFLGTGWRRETTALSREIRTLQEKIAHLERIRWWQFGRRYDRWNHERTARDDAKRKEA